MKFEQILAAYRLLIPCPPRKILDQYCSEQEKDGRFSCIETLSKPGGEDFRFVQCCILRTLAVGYWYTRDKRYENAVRLGIDGWKNMHFQGASDWFNNSILIPRMMLDTLIFMEEHLDREQQDYLEQEITKAYTEERYVYDIGANIVWTNTILLHLACLRKDEGLFARAAGRIREEMKFSDQHAPRDLVWRSQHWRAYISNPIEKQVYEGVQRDYSFFEHGPLLHTGAYGMGYLFSLCQLMYECRFTDTLEEENCRLVIDYLLEHYRWTMIQDTQDYSVIGRKIAAKKHQDGPWVSMEPSMSFLQLLCLLEKTEFPYRLDEIKETRQRLQCKQSAVTGVRYFPQAKYLVSQSTPLTVSIRMTCKDMLASESVNWENLKGWHLGDGVSYIYTDGKNYEGVFPVYDWKKIPGTTTEQKEEPILDWKQHIAVSGSESTLCGGAARGPCAVAAMEMKKAGLRAKKAWFFAEGAWVCLGTDIWCTGEGTVVTTVDQMKKRGTLWVDSQPLQENHLSRQARWIGHSQVAYLFPEGQTVRVLAEKRQGDWNDIAYEKSAQRPKMSVPWEAEMVTLWLDHGPRPQGASYEYHVLPWTEGQTPKAKIRVLANEPSVQAVMCGPYTMAVFWKPGEWNIQGQVWKADAPCVILKEGENIYPADLQIQENCSDEASKRKTERL